MRLHLPLCLLSAVLACYASTSFVAQGALPDGAFSEPTLTGTSYTWTGASDNVITTDENWSGGAAPTRTDDEGPVLIFTQSATTTGTPKDTCDNGGIKVTGEGVSVTASAGSYAGAFYVGEGASLTTTFGVTIKSSSEANVANIWADGALTINPPLTTIVFGGQGNNHYWHIGVNGSINLGATTSFDKKSKTWSLEGIVSASQATDTTLVNRTRGGSTVLTRELITASGAIASSIDTLVIWEVDDSGAYTQLTATTNLDTLASGQYYLDTTANGVVVKYIGLGYAAQTLVWNGGDGAWANKATGWYIQGDTNQTNTSYMEGDTVIFNGSGGTVTITDSVAPAAIQVSSDSDYTISGTITGSTTLVKTGSGTLTLDGSASNFTGNVTIKEGIVKIGSSGTNSGDYNGCGALGMSNFNGNYASRMISVESGGTLDLNGKGDNVYAVTIAGDGVGNQGAIINTADGAHNGNINLPKIILSADASIGGTNNIYLVGPGFALVTIDLANHTLTKKGANTIELTNTTFTAGTLSIEEGTISTRAGSTNCNFSAIDLMTSGSGTLSQSQDLTIKTLNGDGGTIALGGNCLTITNGGTYGGVFTGDTNGRIAVTGGTLILTGANTTQGPLTVSSGATAQLGTGETVTWAGNITGAGDVVYDSTTVLTLSSADSLTLTGTFTLKSGTVDLNSQAVATAVVVKNGTLQGGSAYSTSKGISIDSSEGATITLTGVDSGKMGDVSLAANSTLTFNSSAGTLGDLDLSSSSVSIVLGGTQVVEVSETSTGTPTAMINSKSLTLTASKTELEVSNEAIVQVLKTVQTNQTEAKIALTSGTLSFTDNYKGLLFTNTDVLSKLGLTVTALDGGCLVIGGSTSDVYLVTPDQTETYADTINNYTTLDPYKAVVLDKNESLTATLTGERDDGNADGLMVKNLVGVTGSSLNAKNTDTTGATTAVVVLDNSTLVPSKNPDATLDDGTQIRVGTDTKMEGDINGGDHVAFLKQGDGTLTVTGDVDVDTLKAQEGTIALNGSDSSIDSLVLDSSGTSTATVEVGGSLTTATLTDGTGGGELKVTDKGQIQLTDASALTKSSISGNGTLIIDNTSLSISEDATLDGTQLVLKTGTLNLGTDATASTTGAGATGPDAGVTTTVRTTALLADTAAKSYSVKSLNGDSSSKITLADTTLAVNGTGTSTYSGNIDGEGTLDVSNGTLILNNSGNDKLTLTVAKAKVTLNAASSSTKALRGASSNEISSKGITLNSGSELIVGTTSAADQVLSIGDGGLTLNSGSTLTFNLATEDESALDKLTLVTTTGAIALNSGSTVKLLNDDNTLVSADDETLKTTLMTGGSAATVGNVTFEAAFLSSVYEDLKLQAEGNNVVLTGKAREDNVFSPGALTPNATAGSELLWDSRFSIKHGDSLLKDAYLSVDKYLIAGDNAGAARAMAAIAGSTVNSLGTAQRDSFRNQMAWVRNRTVTMGVDPDYTYDDLPYVHMWVEGTGASAQLNTDGDEGGYKLSSWGGTVGCDVDLTEHFTFGAALSAQFGTLSSSAAEYASGDLDSYYVSLFGRYQKKAWAHTVILTGSKSEGSLDRTVGFDTVSYSTQGTTDGSGFGAMYELTYDIPLNEEKSTIFQPLFNASIVKTSMKGYTETGADNAGLQVGKQDWTTATLALGARWLGLVGTNVFGREALVEVRVNIAQDLGDNQGETKVALIGNPNVTQTVYGAEVGKTAGQIGVGIYLPVGQQGTVFVNGNAEVRSGAHSINGSLGYRYSF